MRCLSKTATPVALRSWFRFQSSATEEKFKSTGRFTLAVRKECRMFREYYRTATVRESVLLLPRPRYACRDPRNP
jgi:hypothetical protein